jgi:hypothetical protein
MRTEQFPTAIFIAAFASASLAQDIDRDANQNGFRLLTAVPAGGSRANAADVEAIYVKVTAPRHRMSVLGSRLAQAEPPFRHAVLNFEIDCAKGAMKYVSVQALDVPWNLRASSLALPRTVWHTPTAGSVPARALDFACKA